MEVDLSTIPDRSDHARVMFSSSRLRVNTLAHDIRHFVIKLCMRFMHGRCSILNETDLLSSPFPCHICSVWYIGLQHDIVCLLHVTCTVFSRRFSVGGVDAASGGKKLSMQEVWDRAHEEFRKKIASQKQMELDVGPPGDDDSDDDADV